MAPRAPPPPPLPAIDPSPFHNLIVEVADCSPPRSRSTFRPKGQQRQHQQAKPQEEMGKMSDLTMYRKSRASMDQDRPPVDPTIRGIPQGWEDDPAVPAISDPQPPSRSLSAAATPQRSATVGAVVSHPPVPASKLGAFRETRVKLSSFSGMVKENLRGERESGRGLSALKSNKGGIRSASRTRPLLAPAPITTSSSAQGNSRPTHAPSQSIHSQLSFSTQATANTDNSIPPPFPGTPTGQTDSTDESAEFTNLFTPSPTTLGAEPRHRHPPSITSIPSTTHSVSSRDRVMGIVKGPLDPNAPHIQPQSRVYNPPNIVDVLPFAGGQPFAAWSVPISEEDTAMLEAKGAAGKRGSIPLHSFDAKGLKDNQSVHSLEGWKEAAKQRWGMPGKKVWVDKKGEEIGGVYRVGWEREVMDLEGRLHETMYEVAGDRHTFAEFEEPPKTVLDIGTGSGFWPISQALEWPQASFVGLDLVPCQTDLSLLAEAERTARSTSQGVITGEGLWESVAKRITWQRANFLTDLPFDTGVFDHVHIRFVGLGVPESKWGDLLEEATRVLKRGGKLEIVETSYTLPSSAPQSLHNSFASLLLADMVQPVALLPLRFNLPSTTALMSAGLTTPVFARTWCGNEIPGALVDAVLVWVRSTLEYKGTGLVKGSGSGGAAGRKGLDVVLEKVKRELAWVGKGKWVFDEGVSGSRAVPGKEKEKSSDDGGKKGQEKESEMSVWAWVATKK
ncbi:hypothetical protein IAT38_000394 [Cryptococcus sp. DSM 104549]